MPWDGDGVDPWLPERIAGEVQIQRAERRLYDSWLATLAAWLVGVRRAVLSGGPRPDPAGVFAKVDDWARRIDEFVNGPVRDVLALAYEQLLGPGFAFDTRPAAVAHLAEVRNRMVRTPDEVFGLVASELAASAALGETPDEMADRVGLVLSTTGTELWPNRAATVARTEAGGALSAGRWDSQVVLAEDLGGEWERVWLATLDTRTRVAHAAADGQRAGVAEPFVVGGEPLLYPGVPTGSAGNVINCRCDTLLVPAGSSPDMGGRQFVGLTGAGPRYVRTKKGAEHYGQEIGELIVADTFEGMTVPALRQIAKDRGVRIPARAKKADIIAALRQEPSTDAATIAADPTVVRDDTIRRGTAAASVLADVDRLLADRAALDEITAVLDGLPADVDPRLAASLRRATATGDRTKIRAAVTRASKTAGITPVGKSGQPTVYDPESHDTFGDAPLLPGSGVVIVRRGSVLDVDGQPVVLTKPVVVGTAATPSTVVETPEDMARARQARIDRARQIGRLAVEVDELVDNGADTATIRARVAGSLQRELAAVDTITGLTSEGREEQRAALARVGGALLEADLGRLRQTVADTVAGQGGSLVGRAGDRMLFDRRSQTSVGPVETGWVEVIRPGFTFTVPGDTSPVVERAVVQEVDRPNPPVGVAVNRGDGEQGGLLSAYAVRPGDRVTVGGSEHTVREVRYTGQGGVVLHSEAGLVATLRPDDGVPTVRPDRGVAAPAAGSVAGRPPVADVVNDPAVVGAALNAGVGQWSGDEFAGPRGNEAFLTIAERQGFTALPTVVSDQAAWDELAATHTPMWRRFQPASPDVADRDVADQFRYGPLYGGGGLGMGTPTSGADDGGVPMLLAPSARTAPYRQLVAERDAYLAGLPVDAVAERAVYSDVGRFAAAKGYDAMQVEPVDAPDGRPGWVVFNRGAVTVFDPVPDGAARWEARRPQIPTRGQVSGRRDFPTSLVLADVPDRRARMAALGHQTPTATRPLGGGLGADTTLDIHPSGVRVVRKVYGRRVPGARPRGQEVDGEVLGPRVLEAVGLRSPATVKLSDTQIVQEHVSGTVGSELVPWGLQPGPDVVDSPDGMLLGLADVLMANSDRNDGNWIRTDDGRIVGIDHGDAFQPKMVQLLVPGPFTTNLFTRLDGYVNNPFTSADITVVRARLEALRPEFDALGRGSWHQQMMRRLDQIGRKASGDTNLIAPPAPSPARLRQVQLDAATSLAGLVADVEEQAGKGASARALVHRVRNRMKRLRLEPTTGPDGSATGYVWKRPDGDIDLSGPVPPGMAGSVEGVELSAARDMATAAVEAERLANAGVSPQELADAVRATAGDRGLAPVGRAGDRVRFDPVSHEPLGPATVGGEVVVVRPGYVWRPPGDAGEVPISRPLVQDQGSSAGVATAVSGPTFADVVDGRPTTVEQVAPIFNTEFSGGLRTEVTAVDQPSGSTDTIVKGAVYNQSGKQIGQFRRSFGRDASGALYAGHELLKLDENVKGSGFATEFNNRLYDWYRRSGVQRVQLRTAWDGGFVWARAGYDWANQESADKVRDRLKLGVDQLRKKNAKPLGYRSPRGMKVKDRERQFEAADALIARWEAAKFGEPDYPTPFELSELGRVAGQSGRNEMWLGKWVMLDSAWNGVKWL